MSTYADALIQALKQQKRIRTFFSGTSMAPTLREGMQLLVEQACPDAIKPADIIMYKKNGQPVAHRVVRIERGAQGRIFLTKGDNHFYVDADRIPEGDLIGRVCAAFPGKGPDVDMLSRDRPAGLCYVVLANGIFAMRRVQKYIPTFIRQPLKPLVDGFFFLLRKIVHIIYIVIRRTSSLRGPRA